jgi:hypothetical protein
LRLLLLLLLLVVVTPLLCRQLGCCLLLSICLQ